MADTDAKEGEKPKKKRLWLWVGLGAVLLLVVLGGGYYFLVARPAATAKSSAPPPAPVTFISLQPFVSNLTSNDGLHYIQVTLKLKTRDPKAQAEVNKRLPEIRDSVLNVLAEQHVADVVRPVGRTRLRVQILEAVNHVLKTGKAAPKSTRRGVGSGAAAGRLPKAVSASNPASAMAAAAAGGPILGVYFTAFVVQ